MVSKLPSFIFVAVVDGRKCNRSFEMHDYAANRWASIARHLLKYRYFLVFFMQRRHNLRDLPV